MRELTRRLLLRLSRAARAGAAALSPDAAAHERAVLAANSGYDMAADPDEAHYAAQYLARLAPELLRLPETARVLDLGCGHGRLTLPAAALLSRASVTGVDLSEEALAAARGRAAEQGIKNVEFIRADAAEHARGLAAASLDAALSTEALYNVPAYRDVIADLSRALKPGGLLFVSLRSQWYELLRSAKARDLDSLAQARDKREGRFGGGAAWSCWHTPAEVSALLTERGFGDVRLYAIGPLSGLSQDPLGALLTPSSLPPEERSRFSELESSLAEAYAGQGRYILAVAKRNP